MQFSEYILRSALAKADPISKGSNEVCVQLLSGTHRAGKSEVARLQSGTQKPIISPASRGRGGKKGLTRKYTF